ncbi:hypothetical protein GKZ28_27310 [Clostridium chromiireducens]|uniref:Uncharacterized protein n=1 Tax=Clostridium chromiireducens TaxID=225345 RepID=A0A964RTG7_9CLOT|nr:hypothetical protein [Clostridium chromiireducens]MVX67338.1 hypothetical protein [Clostridium chromiireducens]
MSIIKLISIILINTFLISVSLINVYSGNIFFIFACPIIGIANYKYLNSNTKLINKQKNIIELFFIVAVVLTIFYTYHFM